MQDDVEEEKELLQKQRAEVAVLREQLKYQVVVITPTVTFVTLTFKKIWFFLIHLYKQFLTHLH